MEHLSPHLLPGAEKSIEANPNLSRRWLEEVAPLFNRISFGVQSFDERKLNFLGRIHTPTQARRAVEWAAEAGFRNINLDLIYGVAGDSWELLERDLNIALSLPITHISAYSLTIEEGTPFASHPNPKLEDEELELRFIEAVASHLPQYEISNFGWICRHNLGYWQLKEYRGIGAGAVGFERGVRYYHHLSVEEYCWNPLPVEEEKIGEEELRVEKVLLGFRSIVGVEGAILTPPQLEKGFKLVEEGLLRWEGGRFYNPNFAIADRLALELLEG
jgi:oxygen-independent coproporphyrinogen-3 oxidase